MFCQFCGSKITEDSKFCESCGRNTETGYAAGSVQTPATYPIQGGSNVSIAPSASQSHTNKSNNQSVALIFGLLAAIAIGVLLIVFVFLPMINAQNDESVISNESSSTPTEQTGKSSETTVHTIIFETDGGTTFNQVQASDGESLTVLPAPEKQGYTFAGWYSDKAFQNAFNLPYLVKPDDPEQIIIYAKWNKDTPPAQNTTPATQPDNASNSGSIYNANAPFWGAWIGTFRVESNAINYRNKAIAAGFNAEIVISTQWSNLNQSESFYCVTVCRATSKELAQSYAQQARAAGFDNAYASYSGEFIRY